jgi:hypothetical protein
MIELKKLSSEATSSALEKAKQYRLLNEPDETESICMDILAVDPTHQETLITLFLALTDKFVESGLNPSFENAQKVISQMDSDFCKSYYTGILFERRAKFHYKQDTPGSGAVAYDWFAKAMKAFGEALSGCDPDNQDALLRWNSCARFINSHQDLESFGTDQPESMLDSYETPH